MSYYVIKGKHSIPGFLYAAIASWMIALTVVTTVCLGLWIIEITAHINLLKASPWSLVTLLDLCGAYAAIGAICLYVTMWIYWVAVERSSVLARVGWLLALLFGLHYGALVYAFVVWRKHVTKEKGVQPLQAMSINR